MIATPNWDRKYLDLAKFWADRCSKDPSTKVGAVVVNWDVQQEFLGYNGFPRGVRDLPERYADRAVKYPFVVHAEMNAIIKAGMLARGATLYVWPSFAFPPVCEGCAKLAIQAGICEVVGYPADLTDPRAKRWVESIETSRILLNEAGVYWRTVTDA